jgi:hypothetical protein
VNQDHPPLQRPDSTRRFWWRHYGDPGGSSALFGISVQLMDDSSDRVDRIAGGSTSVFRKDHVPAREQAAPNLSGCRGIIY